MRGSQSPTRPWIRTVHVPRVIALAAIQTGCALLIVLLQALQPPSLRDSAMLLTALVVAVSGGLGLYGALKHTVWPLHAFFMTQIWVLAAVAAQWMRSQTAAARQAVFYSAQLHPAQSPLAKTALQSVAIFVSFGVVYASMFYTDLLSELLQDALGGRNRTAWLTHVIPGGDSMNYDETRAGLLFAQRVGKIRNRPQRIGQDGLQQPAGLAPDAEKAKETDADKAVAEEKELEELKKMLIGGRESKRPSPARPDGNC